MTKTANRIFIATSLDGYIADSNDGIDWLHEIPNPEQLDMGFADFMAETDALVMGRKTFETVCGFDVEWPYSKPVFVWSSRLSGIPEELTDKAFLVKGSVRQVLKQVHDRGHFRLYIDGGSVIQSFLHEDLIDEMVITTIPVLLGGGIPLFGALKRKLNFSCTDSRIFLGRVVQNRYERIRP